ncbi:MAG: M23 family metallopeptidase [Bacteroidetes bacterium]|nr:MAG: M23 family metallopeptidase [Bacteroidota bacterium]
MRAYSIFFAFFLAYLFCAQSASAQSYTFPVNPNQTAYLTGNMGEIRAGHFHMGLDILANPNTPVYASADGYISKIRISSYGYGKIIHLTHPATKHQTVYAHLNGFAPKFAEYMRQKQYADEKFDIEVLPAANELPVKKGEHIAYIGNTGASQGAHLHYEIRTLDDVALNPSEFGFKELPKDGTPPVIKRLAMVTLGQKSLLNGIWGRMEFSPTAVGKGVYQAQDVLAYGEVGLEVFVNDMMDNANNTYGINRLEMWVNDKKTFGFQLSKIAHEHNRCMNLHVDYETIKQRNQGFQKCYFAEGNRLKGVYDLKQGNGNIKVADGKTYKVKVLLYDVAGNKTTLTFQIVGKKPSKATFNANKNKFKKPVLKYKFQENLLVLEAYNLGQGGEQAQFVFNGIVENVPLTSMQGNKAVFVWDLRKGLPDFARVGGVKRGFHFRKTILPNRNTQFKDKRLKIDFARNPLYDTLYLEANAWNDKITIGNPLMPLLESIVVSYQVPTVPSNKQKMGVYYLGYDYQDSWWEGNTLFFRTRYLGNFQLRSDTEAPKVRVLRKNVQQVVLQARDNLSGLSEHKAWLNGKFILLDFEYKGGYLTTEPLRPNTPMKGTLEVWTKDKAGNEARERFAL